MKQQYTITIEYSTKPTEHGVYATVKSKTDPSFVVDYGNDSLKKVLRIMCEAIEKAESASN